MRRSLALLFVGVGLQTGVCQQSTGFRNLNTQLSTIVAGVPGTVARVAIIGDSWTAQEQITGPLRKIFQSQFGDSGAGYTSLAAKASYPTGVNVVTSGPCTDTDSQPQTLGITLYDSICTPGGTKVVTANAGTFVIHYGSQLGSGVFSYQVDQGPQYYVGTAGTGALTLGTLSVSGLYVTAHTLTLTVVSGQVTFSGVDCQIPGAGVSVHMLGHSGSNTTTWLNANATTWSAGLAALKPNAVGIFLGGINDQGTGIAPTAYSANLVALGNRVRAAVPDADIFLITEADNGNTGTYPLTDYFNAMRTTAQTQGWPCIDIAKAFGPYNNNANGWFNTGAHPNLVGGQVAANVIYVSLYGGENRVQNEIFTYNNNVGIGPQPFRPLGTFQVWDSGGVTSFLVQAGPLQSGQPIMNVVTNGGLAVNRWFESGMYQLFAPDGSQAISIEPSNHLLRLTAGSGTSTISTDGSRMLLNPDGTQPVAIGQVQFVGPVSASCPAANCSAPAAWVKILLPDGSTGYLPVMK